MKFSAIQKYSVKQSGFTLVELAIVLMIIGLLIGGVLRGQELMNNARVTSTIKQVTSYSGAMYTFVDANAAFPGDMNLATSRIPGCTGSCQNGDGNGIIGNFANVWEGGQQAVTTENTQFWKHLALAHLITGVNPSATVPVWGQTHPASAFPGGFTVVTVNSGGGVQQMFGSLVLRLHSCITCANIEGADGVASDGAPVSPHTASQIDRKMDDGLPGSGDVQASAQGNGASVADCEVQYDESNGNAQCVMSFMMKR
jgi:prepilin-type N-terminal cleavage/methylation domain-containing protein